MKSSILDLGEVLGVCCSRAIARIQIRLFLTLVYFLVIVLEIV